MFKKWLIFCTFLISLLFVASLKVSADAQVIVHNQEELKQAINNKEVTNIIIDNDINTTEKLNIIHPLTIEGNNHTIKYVGTFGQEKSTDKTIWSGIYVFQIYKTSATLKNIKLTGANAALLVNGSSLNLVGTIDLSGNGFGGIELSQGKKVEEVSKLNLSDDINIINSTETNTSPTLWVPSDSKDAIITMNGITRTIKSGDELSLIQLESILGINNPDTNDSIIFAIVLGLIGLSIIIFNIKKLKEETCYEVYPIE